jgi:hypothetical protein
MRNGKPDVSRQKKGHTAAKAISIDGGNHRLPQINAAVWAETGVRLPYR